MRRKYNKPTLEIYIHDYVQCICGSATGEYDDSSISGEESEDLVKTNSKFSDDNFWND